ncbi:hypothetical protein TH53_23740 [Pedobacter lusitanus]|uniref:Peptidase M28 domain-containing protein n=1 Tax=Pedobacter lusitanus TaxID=1503925 RepID=A0A0D0FR44_9SPHI|nr:M28 family peptidase [Pedobacter lusitanus]KIO74899.1 hypothetical protein TH53_23740 [Pedobacter lusitanus]
MLAKIAIPISLILHSVFFNASAQNQVPVISNVSFTNNAQNHSLTINYDVDDAENDKLKIALEVTNHAGHHVSSILRDLKGDVGFPVMKGTKKSISFIYPDSIKNIETFTVSLIADDLYKVKIEDLVAQVDTMRLKSYMNTIYGNRYYKDKAGARHKEEVKDLLHNNFSSYNLKANRHDFTYNDDKGQNIIGERTGSQLQPKVYILCGHFDTTKKSPGADDNGSGVAGILEAARILSQYNYKNTIRFIGFDLEEMGLIGSKNYVFNGGLGADEKVDGVINYDMIGFYSTKPKSQLIPKGYDIIFPAEVAAIAKNDYKGDFVVNTGNKNSKLLQDAFTSSASKYVTDLKVVPLVTAYNGEMTPDLMASDHFVFWRKDIKALHIGDGGETRNVFLDTPKDTIEKLNFTFISNIVKTTIATLAELAEINHSSTSTTHIKL